MKVRIYQFKKSSYFAGIDSDAFLAHLAQVQLWLAFFPKVASCRHRLTKNKNLVFIYAVRMFFIQCILFQINSYWENVGKRRHKIALCSFNAGHNASKSAAALSIAS